MWFTSDQHFGHRNIITYSSRPFADVDEMTRELIARHNAVVRPGDTVWHLGDFALDERLVPRTLPLLNGRHHLIAGNHDKCHPCHKRGYKTMGDYLRWGFESIGTEARVGDWQLCHLPYVGDHGEHKLRLPEWRPRDAGGWLLHGHVHEAWKVRDRMINVGVDQWNYAPVHITALEELRKAGAP